MISCQLSAVSYQLGGEMQDFRDLRVWQEAHEFTLAVYRATASFPKEETYGLTSQLRRASASIGSNIASELSSGATEIKRMGAALYQKLTADS